MFVSALLCILALVATAKGLGGALASTSAINYPEGTSFGSAVLPLSSGNFLVGDSGTDRIYFLYADNTLDPAFIGIGGQGTFPTLHSGALFGSALALVSLTNDVAIVAVGAPGWDGATQNEGRVWTFRVNINTGELIGSPFVVDTTVQNPIGAGRSLVSVGDLFSDGGPDLFIGAPNGALFIIPADPNIIDGTQTGQGLLVNLDALGEGSTVIEVTDLAIGLNLGGFTGVSAQGDNLGRGVTAMQLVPGGPMELFIGSPGRSTNTGAFWVCNLTSSVANPVTSNSLVNSTPPNTISQGARFGTVLAPAGDVNADSVLDLWVGALGVNGYRIYLSLLDPNGAILSSDLIDFEFLTVASGMDISTVDFNGDSLLDLVVGVPSENSIYFLTIQQTTGGSMQSVAQQTPNTVTVRATPNPATTTSITPSQTTSNNGGSNPTSSGNNNNNLAAIVGAVVGGVVFLCLICAIVLIVVVIVLSRRRNKEEPPVFPESEISMQSSQQSLSSATLTTQDHYSVFGKGLNASLGGNQSSLTVIDHAQLELVRKLGEGAFGVVFQARYGNQSTAVKQIKPEALQANSIKDFLDETNVTGRLPRHENVVSMIGVCLQPLSIMLEFVPGGSLDKFLELSRANEQVAKFITPQQQIKWMIDIAAGVAHIHANNIVHRDLACRNVLLTEDHTTAKISDFGMSRLNTGEHNYTQSNVGPIKWMAPESLAQKKYSFKSDVWAYGITSAEIFIRDVPYADMDVTQFAVRFFPENLNILSYLPEDIPRLALEAIQSTQIKKPEERPDIATIHSILSKNFDQVRPDPAFRPALYRSDSSLSGNSMAPPSHPSSSVPLPPQSNTQYFTNLTQNHSANSLPSHDSPSYNTFLPSNDNETVSSSPYRSVQNMEIE